MRACLFICMATLAVSVAAVAAAEFSCDLTVSPPPATLKLHQEGGAVAEAGPDGLLLDLRAPNKGKAAWADIQPWFKLPATIRWDQKLAHDSPHCYFTGLQIRDVSGRTSVAGLSGKPVKYVPHLAGLRAKTGTQPDRWYRMVLTVKGDWTASLVVSERAGGAEVVRLDKRFPGMTGKLCRIAFYHNLTPTEGLDGHAEDRGASLFTQLGVRAETVHSGDPAVYRDAELRGYDRRAPMTFNRATVWLGEEHGVIGTFLAFDRAPELLLTGSRQVAAWGANRLCELRNSDEMTSTFIRPNDLDGDDTRPRDRCTVVGAADRADRSVLGSWVRLQVLVPALGRNGDRERTREHCLLY